MRTDTGRKLINNITQTIQHHNLFDQSEKLLIGISGGKDSLTLLDCLYRAGFSYLCSIHVQLHAFAPIPFTDFCKQRSDFIIIHTDILNQVKLSKRKNACYMCSKARRKAIVQYAVDNGFKKIILAHHKNDVVETLLLNMLFQREISTMMPRQALFKGKLEIVRPLYDTEEKDIIRYAGKNQLPCSDWQCGMESDTQRAWLKNQISQWQKAYPKQKIVDNIFHALHNVNNDFLP
ncbi:MAG: hypothetical protein FJ041_05535 [Candidatus Cloacimonetes bacterium]|nr:hypothetical protein [Candidatus Cloacimonadota bacterium]